jgi:hypothetical protein
MVHADWREVSAGKCVARLLGRPAASRGIAVIADDLPPPDAIRPAGGDALVPYVGGIVASLRQEHGCRH